jgi:hypothetical protein
MLNSINILPATYTLFGAMTIVRKDLKNLTLSILLLFFLKTVSISWNNQLEHALLYTMCNDFKAKLV